MRNIFKKLYIIQEKSNRGRDVKLGKGYLKAYRLNPYNPLSYILIPIVLVVGVVMFGFVGLKNEMDFSNPFKWN